MNYPAPWIQRNAIKLQDWHAPERVWSAVEVYSPGYGHICDVSMPVTDNDEHKDNLHLIEAAPYLLAAVEAYMTTYGHRQDHDGGHTMQLARAAIAKAKGLLILADK